MLVQMKHARLNNKLMVFAQCVYLCLNNVRMTSDTQIIVTVEPDCVWPWRDSVQHEFAAPLLVPTRCEIARDSV